MNNFEFPVYYPAYLPAGYAIDAKSIAPAADQKSVLLYTAAGPQSAKIYFSEQARLNKFNYGGFFNGLTDNHQENTKQTHLVYGYTDETRHTAIASLLTNKTWIILDSNDGISPHTLGTIAQQLAALQ